MKPKIPRSPFSLPFEARKSLLRARIRAIAGPERLRRSSVAAAGVLLLVMLLCVNLVSCVYAEAGPTSNPTEPSSDPVEPSSDPVVPSADPVVPPAIAAVLAGEKEYYSGVYGGFLDLAHLSRAEIPDYPEIETDFPCSISQFAVADLDGDGTPEALLTLSYDSYEPDRIAIFHERDGQVYVYFTNFKEMHYDLIRTDGIYVGAFGAAYRHYHKVTAFTDEGYMQVESLADLDLHECTMNGFVYSSRRDMYYALNQIIGAAEGYVEWYPYAGADFSQYFD